MIVDVRREFERRSLEVEEYLRFLGELEKPGALLLHPNKRSHKWKIPHSQSVKVARASAFLIIYNLVEATLSGSLQAVYSEVESRGLSVGEVRGEIREICIYQRFRGQGDPYTSNAETYRGVASKLVDDVVQKSVVSLDTSRLPISGNLDADRIRKLCARHGISTASHPAAKGGADLTTVRLQRNALAHGIDSFAECGAKYTTSDLCRIHNHASIFVRSIVRNVESYIRKGAYVA